MTNPRTVSVMVAALALIACAGGCVRRSIAITSEPSGAEVWLNDVPLGPTPVESDFVFYGTYDVRLRKEGFEPVVTSRDATAPIYEYPGPDLLVAPFPIHNRLEWHFALTPLPVGDDQPAAEAALKARAAELRQRLVDERAKDEPEEE